MKRVAILLTYVGVVHCLRCRPNVDEEVKMLKTEFSTYDTFIFSRYLEAEGVTCSKTQEVIEILQYNFYTEMNWPMNQARIQQNIVKGLVAGTEAEGCVNGLKLFYDQIYKEQVRFDRCVDTPKLQQQYLLQKLGEDRQSYEEEKFIFEEAMGYCFSNFPSECPNAQRDICTRTQMNTFKNQSKSLTDGLNTQSPCMKNFELVLDCLDVSAKNLQKKGEEFLNHLYDRCASLVQDEKRQASIAAYRKPFKFNSTLLAQVHNVRERYLNENNQILDILREYYEKEKNAKNTYEFRPHSIEYFNNMWLQELAPYKEAVDKAVQDNELILKSEASVCVLQADDKMQFVASNEASWSLVCEEEILEDTKAHMQFIRDTLYETSQKLSELGNSAVLDCLAEGYIFRANAVESCYDIKHRDFELIKYENMQKINARMEILEKYNRTYFRVLENRFPCQEGEFQKKEVILEADKVLDELEKCLYKTSGTVYEITPVMPSVAPTTTTTPRISTTNPTATTITTTEAMIG